MKIYSLYESLVREEEVNSGVQSCVQKYGKELFSPKFGGNEPNTDIESNTAQGIFNFTIDSHGKSLSPEFINNLKQLKECVKIYPEILYPEGTAYRGIGIPLEKMLPLIDSVKDDGTFNYIYQASAPVQSWTQDLSVAGDFAGSIGVNRYTTLALNSIGLHYGMQAPNSTFSEPEIKEKLAHLALDRHQLLTKYLVPTILTHKATPDEFSLYLSPMGIVYLLTSDYYAYKIGITKNTIHERLSNIQTGHPEKIDVVKTFNSQHYKKIEHWLHKKYYEKRIEGEWFALNDADVLGFEELCRKLDSMMNFMERENPFFE